MTRFEALQQALEPEEKLLWSEEPDATAYVRGHNIFGLVFVSAWMAACGLGLAQTDERSSPVIWLFGAFGLWTFSTTLWAMLKTLFTHYGISDRRLLIVRHYPWSTVVESYATTDIKFVRKDRNRRGGGDVVFTTTPRSGNKGRVYHEDVGFFGVDDADAVERLIRATFRPFHQRLES